MDTLSIGEFSEPYSITTAAPPIEQDKVDKVKTSCFEEIKQTFHSTCCGLLYRRIHPYTSLISDSSRVVANAVNANWFGFIAEWFKGNSLDSQERHCMTKLMAYAKVLSAVALPFAFYNIGDEIRNIVSGQDRIEALLRLGENFAWLSESSGNILEGLRVLNVVGEAALNWAFSFYAANAVFSLSSLIMHSRHLHNSFRFAEEIDEKLKNNDWLGSLTIVAEKDKVFLQHQFLVDQKDQLAEKIERVVRRVNANPMEAKGAIELLRGRITQCQFSRRMAITSAVVNLIGMIFFLCSPFSLLAFSILTIAPILVVIRFIVDAVWRKKFLASLDRLSECP